MKSLIAIILALTGTFNMSTTGIFQNAVDQTSALSAYEILTEYNIIDNANQDSNATYDDILSAMLNLYSSAYNEKLTDDTLQDSQDFGLIDENSSYSLTQEVTYAELATILCNYLRTTDSFLGATAGVKYNISNFDDIDEQYQYDVLSMYSQGIMSEQIFDQYATLTVAQACEYIAKTINLKPAEDVFLAENYVPIVMYHSVDDEASEYNNYIISSETFEQDLIYLQNHGYTTLFVADLVEILQNNLEFPEKPIILTFDDGYENNYTNVYRLLAEYDMKGIVAPVTLHYYEYDADAFSHLTAEQTVEMSQSGTIEFSNHSYDLHTNDDRYGTLRKDDESYEDYKEFLLADLTKSHNFYIENDIDEPITYSYPYGALSDESEEIMKEFGYVATFKTDPAYLNIIETADDLYGLTRLNRPYGVSSEEFFAQLEMLDVK